jgi:hypothetical protein
MSAHESESEYVTLFPNEAQEDEAIFRQVQDLPPHQIELTMRRYARQKTHRFVRMYGIIIGIVCLATLLLKRPWDDSNTLIIYVSAFIFIAAIYLIVPLLLGPSLFTSDLLHKFYEWIYHQQHAAIKAVLPYSESDKE